MKRFLAVFLTVIVILTVLCNPGNAASDTYNLEGLELQVTVPADYTVITRDISASDQIFSDLGIAKSTLISYFETSNIYLNAISDTYNEEIVVTMTENGLNSFSLLSDTVLNTLVSTLVNQYADYGINVSKYEIYQHSQTKFVRLYYTDTGNAVHGLQYYTVYDGKSIHFTIRSYEGSISPRQETAIKTIVDSIKFDKSLPVSDTGEDTDSFIYADTGSGVIFTIPVNWKQEAFTKDREFIDVMFVSTKEDDGVMIYGSKDIWEQMPEYDRVGYTRSDIDNSYFTKSDIAAVYNTTADKISTVTYNGVEYFKGESSYSLDDYGIDIAMTMTDLIYIDNGWMYFFQFSGTSAHKLYSDFESLLESVQYPAVSNVVGAASATNADSGLNNTNNDSDNSSVISAVVAFLVIAAAIVALVVLFRKMNIESASPTDNILGHNVSKPDLPSNTEPTIACKNCGQSVPLDSVFCHKCGAKIEKRN